MITSVITVGTGGAKFANPVTGLTSVNAATPGYTTVSWTNPSASRYDYVTLTKVIDAGTPSSVDISKGISTYADTPGTSVDVVYSIVAKMFSGNGSNSATVTAASLRTVPSNPVIGSFVASNAGNLTLTAYSGGGLRIAGFDYQLSTTGVFGTTVDTGADPSHVSTGATHGVTYAARIRTRDTFAQVGAWVTSANVTGINDTTGPTATQPTMVWNQAIPGWGVTFTAMSDAAGTAFTTYLQANVGGRGWNTVASWSGGTAQSSYPIAVTDVDRGTIWQMRIQTIDAYGNSTIGTEATPLYSRPKGTFTIAAASSATWKTVVTAGYRSDTDDLISDSAAADPTWGDGTGFWFYGTAVADTVRGYAPDLMQIFMLRQGSQGTSGTNAIGPHSNANSSTHAVSGVTDTGPNLTGTSASTWYTLPSGWYASFGSNAYKGVGTTYSGSRRRLAGVASNAYSGALYIVFN